MSPSSMYASPIRPGLLSTTNQIAACKGKWHVRTFHILIIKLPSSFSSLCRSSYSCIGLISTFPILHLLGLLDRGLCGSVSIVCQRIIVFDKACIKPLFLAIHEPSNEMSPCQPGVFCVGNVLLERRGDLRADSILHEKLQN